MDIANQNRKQARLLFLLVFVLETAFGIYLVYGRGLLLSDAVRRTANAFFVFSVQPFRFSAMGLALNPLPSILQLPFAALAKLWRPFASAGIGAAVVTALFAAWSAKMLFETGRSLSLSTGYTAAFALITALNPYLLYYGANGMCEALCFAFILRIVTSLTLWMYEGSSGHLVRIAMGFVALFFTRYETLPFAAAVTLCIVLFILVNRRERGYTITAKRSERYFYVEGTLILVLTPVFYALLVWVLYNWVVAGDPLYFVRAYAAQAVGGYAPSLDSVGQALLWAAERSWPFLVPAGAVLTLRLLTGRLFRWDTLLFLLCALTLTVVQAFLRLRGAAAGDVRSLSYPLVIAAAWIPYELQTASPRLRKFLQAVLLILMAALAGWFGWAFSHGDTYWEESRLALPAGSRAMATYINNRLPPGSSVLLDASHGYEVFLTLNAPETAIITSRPDFASALADPVFYHVAYILVSDPAAVGEPDAVNVAYPALYRTGAAWAQEVVHIGEFKLFRVIPPV